MRGLKRIAFLFVLGLGLSVAVNAQLLDGTIANIGTRQLLYSDVEMELVRARIQNPEVQKKYGMWSTGRAFGTLYASRPSRSG